jgi:hypothetical protein
MLRPYINFRDSLQTVSNNLVQFIERCILALKFMILLAKYNLTNRQTLISPHP